MLQIVCMCVRVYVCLPVRVCVCVCVCVCLQKPKKYTNSCPVFLYSGLKDARKMLELRVLAAYVRYAIILICNDQNSIW